jgi:hypothetical protein
MLLGGRRTLNQSMLRKVIDVVGNVNKSTAVERRPRHREDLVVKRNSGKQQVS